MLHILGGNGRRKPKSKAKKGIKLILKPKKTKKRGK